MITNAHVYVLHWRVFRHFFALSQNKSGLLYEFGKIIAAIALRFSATNTP